MSTLLTGVHPSPGPNHPAGYPLLLRFLEPFQSLLLVISVQHLMGIVAAVVVYAVLRRWGLPAGGAVLAACPTLFDARQVALESAVLPDTLYALLLALARRPSCRPTGRRLAARCWSRQRQTCRS